MAFSQKNRNAVADKIRNREEFKHASMSGKWISETDYLPSSEFGQLQYHPETIAEMKDLLKDRHLYVVYSYATPIAYSYDREIHIPDHHYSATTTHHQTIVKAANR